MILPIAPQNPEFPPELVPLIRDITQGLFTMIAVIALGIPIIRLISRRLERGRPTETLPPDLTARLERIEQAVEAVAIEVERIAEAQRFSAKLLAGQQRALPREGAQ
jgi:hypothetical protein